MDMKETVWGMIGCGDVTEKKSGPGLYKANGSRLKGVYNRTEAKAHDWVKRHGHGQVYATVEELLADEEITAVYIATPPATHFDYAMQVIAANKVPLIEKPMARTFEECQAILDAAEEKDLPVFVSFYRRALEKFQKIKELLDEGAIGQPQLVEIRQYQQPAPEDLDKDNLPWRLLPAAGGGKDLDIQVHVLDYLAYYFGDITAMTGIVENRAGLYEVEDTVSASFRFANGVVGSAAWCYVADFDLDEVTIIGSEGTLVFEGTSFEWIRLIKDGETTTYTFETPEHVAMPFIQTVVDELNGKAKSPADAASAANGIRMFDVLLKDYRERYESKSQETKNIKQKTQRRSSMSIGYACLNIGTPNTNIRSVMQRNATPEKLTEVTAHNLEALEKMVDYNIAQRYPPLPHQLGPDPVRFESGQCTRLAGNPQGSLRTHRR